MVEDGDRVVSAACGRAWPGSGAAARSRVPRPGLPGAGGAPGEDRAVEWGYAMLQVDASDDSRPILERLGLHVVGATVPYETTPEQ